jgi:hypothetical protein
MRCCAEFRSDGLGKKELEQKVSASCTDDFLPVIVGWLLTPLRFWTLALVCYAAGESYCDEFLFLP